MKRIRILLVDDHELLRRGLRNMLEQEEDMEIVGDCSTDKALSEMARLHEDIVLMGTQVSGMNGIEATRRLKRHGLNFGGDVIILADSPDYRAEALAAGASSYLLKDIAYEELVQVIRQVYRNRQSSKERDDPAKEVLELVIPPPANAAHLLRFVCQLGEILEHEDFASIICTTGSWDRGTVITVWPQPTTLSSLLITLANMPEVEKVEEEPLARGAFSSFTKKLRLLPRLGINSGKRVRVTLKEETSTAKQLELAGYSS